MICLTVSGSLPRRGERCYGLIGTGFDKPPRWARPTRAVRVQRQPGDFLPLALQNHHGCPIERQTFGLEPAGFETNFLADCRLRGVHKSQAQGRCGAISTSACASPLA